MFTQRTHSILFRRMQENVLPLCLNFLPVIITVIFIINITIFIIMGIIVIITVIPSAKYCHGGWLVFRVWHTKGDKTVRNPPSQTFWWLFLLMNSLSWQLSTHVIKCHQTQDNMSLTDSSSPLRHLPGVRGWGFFRVLTLRFSLRLYALPDITHQ